MLAQPLSVTGIGACSILFVACLAIYLALSRKGHVILGQLLISDVSLFQEGIECCRSHGIGLHGIASLCLLKCRFWYHDTMIFGTGWPILGGGWWRRKRRLDSPHSIMTSMSSDADG
jgi:hypothetical protein